jgi:hypothetical protein
LSILESQNLVGQHKRNSTRNKTEETVSTSTTKTDALLAQVDDLDLSELCRTINEPSDLGDENIDETVSANTLNDSLTIEKEINNGETPSQMTEFDISSIDNEQVDAKKKKAKTGKSSKSLKKPNNESNSDVQCICKGTGKSSLIQCSWCQMWLHVTCVNLFEKETIGFWVCPTCRELPRTVLKISEQSDAVIKNNMDLVKDTAAKIVRIHELEAENKMIMFSRLVFSGRCKIADEISLTLPPRMHIGSVSHSKRRLLMSLIIELPIRSVPLGFRTSLFSVGVLVDKCTSSHTCISVS